MTGKSVAVFVVSGVVAAALSATGLFLLGTTGMRVQGEEKLGAWKLPVGAGAGGTAALIGSRLVFPAHKTAATVGSVAGAVPVFLIGSLLAVLPPIH